MDEDRTVTVTRRITEAWRVASRENGAKAKTVVQTEEHRAKLREGQAARRERERQEKEALLALNPPVEKKRAGRPRIRPVVDDSAPRRGRGRPRKQDENQPVL